MGNLVFLESSLSRQSYFWISFFLTRFPSQSRQFEFKLNFFHLKWTVHFLQFLNCRIDFCLEFSADPNQSDRVQVWIVFLSLVQVQELLERIPKKFLKKTLFRVHSRTFRIFPLGILIFCVRFSRSIWREINTFFLGFFDLGIGRNRASFDYFSKSFRCRKRKEGNSISSIQSSYFFGCSVRSLKSYFNKKISFSFLGFSLGLSVTLKFAIWIQLFQSSFIVFWQSCGANFEENPRKIVFFSRFLLMFLFLEILIL